MITYFVRGGDFIKIGQTRNLKGRIASLQVSNPHRLSVIKTTETVTEREAHAIASKLTERKASEWFGETQELLAWIESLEESTKHNLSRSERDSQRHGTKYATSFYLDLMKVLSREEKDFLIGAPESQRICISNFIDRLMRIHGGTSPQKRAKTSIRLAMLEYRCRRLTQQLNEVLKKEGQPA
ncbi:MAG: GIY-YIG nuclease family protein [Acidobacteriales bacterium]|nr:GIY-YIG nuclease family protein [Terriglobales bacterium]